MAPLAAAGSIPVMTPLSILGGLCFAPITTIQTAAIDEVAAEAHRAEAYTWLGTVYGAGSALGAAPAGLRPRRADERHDPGQDLIQRQLGRVDRMCVRRRHER